MVSEPASVELQSDLNYFVTEWEAELKPEPSVTEELQLAERDLNWLLQTKTQKSALLYSQWRQFDLNTCTDAQKT